ncbi:MAG: Smr/MutS family protein [Phycisphaerales bacterium]|nr:Smr/MutS family protein [Phycisphaerales bacterium]MCB9863903.1 Smr/MutS family protein [Phycisphaerales bacterium]
MARFWTDCFCWDLEDEGVDAAIGRIKGDLFADEICVLAHSDDVVQRRARDFGGARTIRHEAGAHFRPSASHYSATRIRPIPTGWMKSRDPFSRIAKACDSIGVGLAVRASCLRNAALVHKHPMIACVDAFGDASRNRLCPANPDVREFVVALAADLAESYPARRVELADVTFDSSRYARGSALGLDLKGAAQSFQDWCFCPACRQRALDHGCHVEAAHAAVRQWLDRAFERGATGRLDEVNSAIERALRDDADIRSYQEARRSSEASLIAAVHARLGDKLAIPVNDDAELAGVGPSATELGFALVARYKMTPSTSPVPRAVRALGGPEDVAVRFDAYPPYIDGGPALVAAVHETIEAGHLNVGFYADGVLPAPCLDWIRQAIRYARREG